MTLKKPYQAISLKLLFANASKKESENAAKNFSDYTGGWDSDHHALGDIINSAKYCERIAKETILKFGKKTDEARAAKAIQAYTQSLKAIASGKIKSGDWEQTLGENLLINEYKAKCHKFTRLMENRTPTVNKPKNR